MLIGLVGKPSCGKSTFFKAATLADVAIASYPFTTIKSNSGIGYVKINCPETEQNLKCNPNSGFCIKGKRFVPFELMDVAGLVRGASEGKGLGNSFLDDLRQADAFIHIVDVSGTTDCEGKPTENSNPSEDIEFLEEELNNWFFNILMRFWGNFIKRIGTNPKENFVQEITKQFSGLKVNEEHVKSVLRKNNFPEKPGIWKRDELFLFASLLRQKSKPTIIAANKIDMERGKENYEKLKKRFPELIIIPCSADSELALREASKLELINYVSGERNFEIIGNLNDKQKSALENIRKNVLNEFENGTGVQAVLNYVVLDLLKYVPVFPVDNANKFSDRKGRVLPDCFLLPENSTALDFAYFLHTDFGKNFIKAIDAKTKRILGKDYEIKSGDVLEILTK